MVDRKGPEVTVIFPLYRAEDSVPGLVRGIARQRPGAGADARSWLKAIFIDNASPDSTVDVLERCLADAALPFEVAVVRNEENLGLARSFNRALRMVDTDVVLTCHADCRFGSDDYVARAVELLRAHPDVAVVSGQPVADVEGGISRVEKVYLAANLMDIFPDGDSPELVPLGFAEGRCDAFRMEAVRAAGFYDIGLRRAGEDQIMSARLRRLGWRVCKAPALQFYLSVSSDQDSLLKLVRHAELFGRVTPYLLMNGRGTVKGMAGRTAGRNRTSRSALRAFQLAGAAGWIAFALGLIARRRRTPGALLLAGSLAGKAALSARHRRDLGFDGQDTAALVLLQPMLDVAYAAGVARGMAALLVSRRPEPEEHPPGA